jgi:hypothetical protein
MQATYLNATLLHQSWFTYYSFQSDLANIGQPSMALISILDTSSVVFVAKDFEQSDFSLIQYVVNVPFPFASTISCRGLNQDSFPACVSSLAVVSEI